MDAIEAIMTTRAIRRFGDEPVTDEEIWSIIQYERTFSGGHGPHRGMGPPEGMGHREPRGGMGSGAGEGPAAPDGECCPP